MPNGPNDTPDLSDYPPACRDSLEVACNEYAERVHELEALVAELLAACEKALINAGKYEQWLASRIATTYDAMPEGIRFSLKEVGFFDLLEDAARLQTQLKTAIAEANQTD